MIEVEITRQGAPPSVLRITDHALELCTGYILEARARGIDVGAPGWVGPYVNALKREELLPTVDGKKLAATDLKLLLGTVATLSTSGELDRLKATR